MSQNRHFCLWPSVSRKSLLTYRTYRVCCMLLFSTLLYPSLPFSSLRITILPFYTPFFSVWFLCPSLLYACLLFSSPLFPPLHNSLQFFSLLYYSFLDSAILYSTLLFFRLLYYSFVDSTILFSTLRFFFSTLFSLLYSTFLESTFPYSTLLFFIPRFSTLLSFPLLSFTLIYSTLLYCFRSTYILFSQTQSFSPKRPLTSPEGQRNRVSFYTAWWFFG